MTETFIMPLKLVAVIVAIFACLKTVSSISLFFMELILGVILFFGAHFKNHNLLILFVIFEILKDIQFLWVFGQIA